MLARESFSAATYVMHYLVHIQVRTRARWSPSGMDVLRWWLPPAKIRQVWGCPLSSSRPLPELLLAFRSQLPPSRSAPGAVWRNAIWALWDGYIAMHGELAARQPAWRSGQAPVCFALQAAVLNSPHTLSNYYSDTRASRLAARGSGIGYLARESCWARCSERVNC
jgi:hypothetical protein